MYVLCSCIYARHLYTDVLRMAMDAVYNYIYIYNIYLYTIYSSFKFIWSIFDDEDHQMTWKQTVWGSSTRTNLGSNRTYMYIYEACYTIDVQYLLLLLQCKCNVTYCFFNAAATMLHLLHVTCHDITSPKLFPPNSHHPRSFSNIISSLRIDVLQSSNCEDHWTQKKIWTLTRTFCPVLGHWLWFLPFTLLLQRF